MRFYTNYVDHPISFSPARHYPSDAFRGAAAAQVFTVSLVLGSAEAERCQAGHAAASLGIPFFSNLRSPGFLSL